MKEPVSETMIFERTKLVELHRRYADNSKRGHELVALAKIDGTPEEVIAHEYQAAKSAGMMEAIEEIFFIHDGVFEVK